MTAKISFKAKIPLFGEGNAELQGKAGGVTEHTTSFKSIDFNLELAQDVGEVLTACSFNKFVVLENFHYLSEEVQQAMAFDLRSFQELGYRFIILGIWREKNRLIQFNGDLVDRVIEIPVEPWEADDFHRVIEKGCQELQISFSQNVIDEIKKVSFGSIGIVQELCKESCYAAGVTERCSQLTEINNLALVREAINAKITEYSSRHLRSLESIADGRRSHQTGLFMPYFVVRVMITSDISELKDGLSRSDIWSRIRDIHHRPDDVRSSDMSYLLHGLAELQNEKK
ncbi:hypothetical protein AV540_00250 [Brevibacillus parabrevis]|uniref:hypothetical protein n=1 Tax=Brevibacillus parabrevis TaxID=54914 RepID=UPI0007AB59E8|nr:hypothetical protein [Brevibacillus parabrevis]KZE51439.1 hypothetical protein AV540_00250 [Brevibacillus parabrevis]